MKKSTIRSIVMLGLVAVLVVMVGGGILEKASLDNLKKDKAAQTAKEDFTANSDLEPVTEASVFENQKSTDKAKTEKTTTEKTEVMLYFASAEGDKLVAEKREIPTVSGIAKETIQELTKGPANKKLKKTLPEGTKLMDIDVKNGLATVSFSKELHKHLAVSDGEQITVYSIVNTLTQFPTIKRVQILIDGKTVDTLAGHLAIADPIEKNTKIVKGE